MSRWKSVANSKHIGKLALSATIAVSIAMTGQSMAATNAHVSQQKIVLTFANWVSAEAASRAYVNEVITAFEKLHPNITIRNIAIPFNGYGQQMVTMAAGGNAPDVMLLSGNWPAELAAENVLEPLNSFGNEGGYLSHNYSKNSGTDPGMYQGKLYAIPSELTPHGFWYNKALMAKAGIKSPPTTITQLNKDLVIIHKKLPGVYGIGIDTSKVSYALTEFYPYFWTFGVHNMLRNPNNPNFDQPGVIRAFSWLQWLAKNNYTPIGDSYSILRQLTADNKIVFRLDGPYFKGILQSLNPALNGNSFYSTFGVTTTPTDGYGRPVTASDIHNIGMSKESPNKQAAWEFMTFFASSPQSIKDYIIPMGTIPPQKTSFNYPAFKNPVNQEFIKKIIPSAKTMPYGPKFGTAGEYILTGMQQVVSGANVKQVVNQVNQELKVLY